MDNEQRLSQLERDIDEIREVLYKNNLMVRPTPKPVAHPVADASNVDFKTYGSVPGVDMGVDVLFDYACRCGESHRQKLERVKGVRYGSVQIYTATCSNGVTTRVHISVPEDEAKRLVKEAIQDYSA